MTQPRSFYRVKSIDEINEDIAYKRYYTDGLSSVIGSMSFETLLSATTDMHFNIDALTLQQQNFFLAKFFHQPNILVVTNKGEDDPTTVTLPDDPDNTLIGTVPTQQEIDTAPSAATFATSATLTVSANSKQIGGDHYKSTPIQPWDYATVNDLDFMQGSVVKYITRYKDKHPDPLVDLNKALHFIEKMIESETAKQNSHGDFHQQPTIRESVCAKHYTQYSPEYEDCINKINSADTDKTGD